MTPRQAMRDVPASVRQRLLNLAREQRLRFEGVLQRYAVERFLYRLSASDEADRFTLKGAALLRVWAGQELRPTRDIASWPAAPATRPPFAPPYGTSAAFPVERTASSRVQARTQDHGGE